ncbi:hypothetical protein AeRB84_006992 [Aphanomyces euteiches]|nr:hypothetical protein AeRB84_006992 [Aphanomyces euteiches]
MMRRLEDEREDLQAQVETLTGTQANERSEYDTTIKLLENKVEALLEANASAGILMADLRAEISSVESNATDMAAMHTEKTTELRDQIKTLTAQLESERSQRIELQAQSAKLKENLG